jgi:DNA polymerase III subunit delta
MLADATGPCLRARRCYPVSTVSDRPLRSAYLIAGSDRPKVRRAVTKLRRRVVEEAGSDLNVVVFDAETTPVDEVLEAAEMPGFTLGTRLLLVLSAHKWRAESRKALAAYVNDPLPDTCLAVEGESFSEADALRKAIVARAAGLGIEAREVILTFDLPKKYEMAGWVRERAKAHHLPMGVAVARHFLQRCGVDPKGSERLEREIEKLAVYCRGREATADDVDAVCSPDDDARIFSLMDAVGERQSSRAFALLEMVYLAGEDPNKIVFMLARHMEQLEGALRLEGADAGRLAKELGLPFWTAKRVAEQSLHYDHARLARAAKALAGAEAGMRGRAPATLETESGVNHTDRFVLELALARLLA